MASSQEIVNIANHFLLSAPPGELLEVAVDVRGLLENDTVLNETALDTFREYTTEQCHIANTPKGQVVICKFGETESGEYIDHRGKQVIAFDFLRQEMLSSQPLGPQDSTTEPLRSALDDSLMKYATEYYPSAASATFATLEEGRNVHVMVISGARFQPENYNTGRWRSLWRCFPEGKQMKVTGHIRINVHYYEAGNVQMSNEYHRTVTVPMSGNNAATAADILKQVAKFEAEMQESIDSLYLNMNENTFKALRRPIPVSGKIPWEKILHNRVAVELAQRK